MLPDLPAVGGAEYATLLVGAEGVAQGRHVDDVRVVWMETHARDVACVLEPEMRPGLATICGFVDSVTVRHIEADAGLTHASVNDIGVRLSNRDSAHRCRVQIAV